VYEADASYTEFFLRRYKPLYCCLGTVEECGALDGQLPQRVYDEVLRGLAVLEPYETGSFSIVADTETDLAKARVVFDDRTHYCEWATRLGNSGYVSALYLLNNEFSVILYTKESLANEDVLENLEF
jgi:hypothetical protein